MKNLLTLQESSLLKRFGSACSRWLPEHVLCRFLNKYSEVGTSVSRHLNRTFKKNWILKYSYIAVVRKFMPKNQRNSESTNTAGWHKKYPFTYIPLFSENFTWPFERLIRQNYSNWKLFFHFESKEASFPLYSAKSWRRALRSYFYWRIDAKERSTLFSDCMIFEKSLFCKMFLFQVEALEMSIKWRMNNLKNNSSFSFICRMLHPITRTYLYQNISFKSTIVALRTISEFGSNKRVKGINISCMPLWAFFQVFRLCTF